MEILRKLSVQEFDSEYRDIEGQIELDFCGHKYGYYNQEDPFGDELLITWFVLLNEAASKLNKSNYVALKHIESDVWFEFLDNKDIIKVSLMYIDNTFIDKFIVTAPFNNYKYGDWKDVTIKKIDFQIEIQKKTIEFIDSIRKLNQSIIKSQSIKELKALVESV
ncbi:hypothetical protein [Melghirimyces profundicolus]|nr:hypothetical protein [Melghirimyces profundicolus]